jgi:hypothetical protein
VAGDCKLFQNGRSGETRPKDLQAFLLWVLLIRKGNVMNTLNQGHRARIFGGDHAGKMAWYDKSKQQTRDYVWVWVTQPDGQVISRRVLQINAIRYHKPEGYGEAIIYQHPHIHGLMNKLAKEAARCRLDGQSEVTEGFVDLLKDMIGLHLANLLKKHARARFYDVVFERPPVASVEVDVLSNASAMSIESKKKGGDSKKSRGRSK